jgi:hypothetical protein
METTLLAIITYTCPDRQSWHSTQPHFGSKSHFISLRNPCARFLLAGPRLPAKKKGDYFRQWLDEGIRLIDGK